MTVSTAYIELNTKGKADIVDLTSQVSDNLNKTKISCGTVIDFDNRPRKRKILLQFIGK